MKKSLFALLFVGLLVLSILPVFAENNNSANPNANRERNQSREMNKSEVKEAIKEIKNATRTYGSCVSENAKEKNTCYASAKDKQKNCTSASTNASLSKNVKKQCKTDYNNEIRDCKKVFKDAKKECGKIKHSAMEALRHSFD